MKREITERLIIRYANFMNLFSLIVIIGLLIELVASIVLITLPVYTIVVVLLSTEILNQSLAIYGLK